MVLLTLTLTIAHASMWCAMLVYNIPNNIDRLSTLLMHQYCMIYSSRMYCTESIYAATGAAILAGEQSDVAAHSLLSFGTMVRV